MPPPPSYEAEAKDEVSTDGIFKATGEKSPFTWVRCSEFYVTANVTESGAIQSLKISQTAPEGGYTADVCASAAKGVNAKYTVTLKLTAEDLNSAATKGA